MVHTELFQLTKQIGFSSVTFPACISIPLHVIVCMWHFSLCSLRVKWWQPYHCSTLSFSRKTPVHFHSGGIFRKTHSGPLPELLLLCLSRSAAITSAAGQMSSAVLSQRKMVATGRCYLTPCLLNLLPLFLWFSHLFSLNICFSIQWTGPSKPSCLFLSAYVCSSSVAVAVLWWRAVSDELLSVQTDWFLARQAFLCPSSDLHYTQAKRDVTHSPPPHSSVSHPMDLISCVIL